MMVAGGGVRRDELAMRFEPAPFLAFLGGYVDTLGFLALHGLFAAHVTGNFVTISASLARGADSGIVTKPLALPVFCLVVIAARLAGRRMAERGWPELRILFWAEIALLALGAAVAARHGGFGNTDEPRPMLLSFCLVAAMAIQNAVHRTHMASDAPSTLVTGSTTQMLIDFVDLLNGAVPESRPALRARAARLLRSVAAFAAGCGLAAWGFVSAGNDAFLVPPVVALLAWISSEALHRAPRAG